MLTSSIKGSFRIAVLYAATASLWILFSDSLLNFMVEDVKLVLKISIFKGWIFIAFTGMMLYYLIKCYTVQYMIR
ncbi:MAG: hypothetical protein H7X79_14250 [Sporomusaceae bacterium]|nr:hypothetical protein [Sporomusaceae bacterium]